MKIKMKNHYAVNNRLKRYLILIVILILIIRVKIRSF